MKNTLKSIGLAALLCFALLVTNGCVTSTTVTPGVNGGQSVTNVVVNLAQLNLDCSVIQVNTAVAVSLAKQKDPSIVPILTDTSIALTGVLNGASTNSSSQVIALLGQNSNTTITSVVTPVINEVSSLEQSYLAKYGATVSGTITLAIAKAFSAGLAQGLAGQ